MNRKQFLTTTGLISLGSIVAQSVFSQNEKPNKKSTLLKEKIVLKNEGETLNFLGDKQTIKLTGKDTDNLFTLIYQVKPPKTKIPMHVHQKEDEVYSIIEGEIEFTVGGKTSVLKGGDTIFLPKNIPHGWKVIGNVDALVHLSIFPSGLENMFVELNKLPAGPLDLPSVAAICARYGVKFV